MREKILMGALSLVSRIDTLTIIPDTEFPLADFALSGVSIQKARKAPVFGK